KRIRGSGFIASSLLAAACGRPPDGVAESSRVAITATVNSTRFTTREHMLAGGEMQISGEPLAESMGRDLNGYFRFILPTDLYYDENLQRRWIDLPGFSTGVESYEYSKQPMNGLAFEFGAGTSLAHAPLVNTDNATGAAATAHLATLVQRAGVASNATTKWVFAPGTYPAMNKFGNKNPKGTGNPANNPVGWPGIWPTAHVFASFDPASDPSGALSLACAVVSDDGDADDAPINGDYECDATSSH